VAGQLDRRALAKRPRNKFDSSPVRKRHVRRSERHVRAALLEAPDEREHVARTGALRGPFVGGFVNRRRAPLLTPQLLLLEKLARNRCALRPTPPRAISATCASARADGDALVIDAPDVARTATARGRARQS